MDQEPEEPRLRRPFMDTLRDLEHGYLLETLTDEQHKLVAAIESTMRPGSITIKLTYKLEGRGQVAVSADVKSTLPALPRGKSLFFVTPEGNLQRDVPNQHKLDLAPRPDSRKETA